jgi:hypothetical protein
MHHLEVRFIAELLDTRVVHAAIVDQPPRAVVAVGRPVLARRDRE